MFAGRHPKRVRPSCLLLDAMTRIYYSSKLTKEDLGFRILIYPKTRDRSKDARGLRRPMTCNNQRHLEVYGPVLFRHHHDFVLRHGVERGLVNAEVSHREVRWCVAESFREREVLIEAALEHFQKFQVGVARVLNIVGQRFLDIANVPGLKVRSTGAASGCEHRHSSCTADEVLPFVGIGMPVELANPSRMDGYHRRRNRGGNVEVAGINDPYLASLGALRNRVLYRTECEVLRGCAPRAGGRLLIGRERARNRSLEN